MVRFREMPPVGRPIARVPRCGLCVSAVVFVAVLWGCPKAFTAGTSRWLHPNGRSRIVERNSALAELSNAQAKYALLENSEEEEKEEEEENLDLVQYVTKRMEVNKPPEDILNGMLERVLGRPPEMEDFTMKIRYESSSQTYLATLNIWVLRTQKKMVPTFKGRSERRTVAKDLAYELAFRDLPPWLIRMPKHEKERYKQIGIDRLMESKVHPKHELAILVGRCHRRVMLRETDLKFTMKPLPGRLFEVTCKIGTIEGMPEFKPLKSVHTMSKMAEWQAAERALEYYEAALRERADKMEDPLEQPMPQNMDCVDELVRLIRQVDHNFQNTDLDWDVGAEPQDVDEDRDAADANTPYKVTLRLPAFSDNLDKDGWGDVPEVEGAGETLENAKQKAAWVGMSLAAKFLRRRALKARAERFKGKGFVGVRKNELGEANPFVRLRNLMQQALGPIAYSEGAIQTKMSGKRQGLSEVQVHLGFADILLGTDTRLAFSGVAEGRAAATDEALKRAGFWMEEWLLKNEVNSFHSRAERAASNQSLLLKAEVASGF